MTEITFEITSYLSTRHSFRLNRLNLRSCFRKNKQWIRRNHKRIITMNNDCKYRQWKSPKESHASVVENNEIRNGVSTFSNNSQNKTLEHSIWEKNGLRNWVTDRGGRDGDRPCPNRYREWIRGTGWRDGGTSEGGWRLRCGSTSVVSLWWSWPSRFGSTSLSRCTPSSPASPPGPCTDSPDRNRPAAIRRTPHTPSSFPFSPASSLFCLNSTQLSSTRMLRNSDSISALVFGLGL